MSTNHKHPKTQLRAEKCCQEAVQRNHRIHQQRIKNNTLKKRSKIQEPEAKIQDSINKPLNKYLKKSMLKYSLVLIGVYILYYAGIIIYDLFLKREKITQTEMTEEFSLGDFAEANSQKPNSVEIQDVENLRTPKSYLKTELSSEEYSATFEDYPDLEELRKKFEAEEDIDEIRPSKNVPQTEEEVTTETVQEENTTSIPNEETQKTDNSNKKNHWKELLNLSETTIKMVANYEGQKVYHSMM